MALTKVSYSMIEGETFSIKDFGATTGADNTTAIQAAFDACSGNGSTVLLDVESLISTPILVQKDNVVVAGNFTKLSFSNPFTPYVNPLNPQGSIEIPNSMFKVFADNIVFRNLFFDNTDFCQFRPNYANGSCCIETLTYTKNCLVDGIYVFNDPYIGGASVLFREYGESHICRNSWFVADTAVQYAGNAGCSGWGNQILIEGNTAINLEDEHLSITAGGRSKILGNTVINVRDNGSGGALATGAGIAVANAAYDFEVCNNTIYTTTNGGIVMYNATTNLGDSKGVIANNNILSQSLPVTVASQQCNGIVATSQFNNLVITGNYINIVGNTDGVNANGISVPANGAWVHNNVIVVRSGSMTSGIFLRASVAGAAQCIISNNYISDPTGTVGILLQGNYNNQEIHITDNFINGCTFGIGEAYGGGISNVTPYLDGNIFIGVTNYFGNGASTQAILNEGNGLLLVGPNAKGGTVHCITRDVANDAGNIILEVGKDNGASFPTSFTFAVSTAGFNAANNAYSIGRDTVTSRSINAGGTVNASGTDYAEYMVKNGDFTIAKGDICGVDSNGKLTNKFADSVSFVVKSTNPSYVGGDSWGVDLEANSNELEAARQQVDRIAFSGQVPVNVYDAIPGQYIVPIDDNDTIKGIAVSNPTFEQYQISVGKVIATEPDKRAKIIVKVS